MVRRKILALATALLVATPAVAGELKLQSLQVNASLKAGKPYTVKLPYTKTGSVTVKEGCFIWTWEGPYCFPVDVRTKTIRVKLRTNTPNTYELIGFVRYQGGGKLQDSNRVQSTINVKR